MYIFLKVKPFILELFQYFSCISNYSSYELFIQRNYESIYTFLIEAFYFG